MRRPASSTCLYRVSGGSGGAEADRVRRRCVRMIRERTGVSAALFCEQSRGVFPGKLALRVRKAFPEIDREATMDFYIRRS